MHLLKINSQKLKPVFYGLAELGPASIDIFLKVYLLIFFNQVMGLSPSLTSLAIGLGVVWDAFIDPFIGIYSDRFYYKYGNRKKLIYGAIIASAALFCMLWRMPQLSQWPTFFILFLISALLNSSISLFAVPYIAVANDLVFDNEERKPWIGWRLACFNLGSFVGLIVPAYYLMRAEGLNVTNIAMPYQEASLRLGFVMIILSIACIYLVYQSKNKTQPSSQVSQSVKLKVLLSDKQFLRMMISYFVVNCGLGLNSALAIYYYKNYLEYSEKQTQIILVGFLFIFTFSIPFWVYLTKYFNKQKLIMTGTLLLGLLTVTAFPQFKGVDFKIVALLACGLGGIFVGVAVVLEIYLSEFLKEKETSTGQNVSGQYLGIWKMASKVSRGVAIVLAGPILENVTNTQMLANYFGWGVGTFFIAGGLIITYPLSTFKK